MIRRIDSRKEKRKKFWMGSILVFLMIASMLGVILGSTGGERVEYNGYKFKISEQGFYVLKIKDQNIGFRYLPQDLDSLNLSTALKTNLQSPMIYLSFDPDYEVQDLLYIDLVRMDFENLFKGQVISGITNKSDNYQLPIISCENASRFIPVIFFNVSEETSVKEIDNCVIINGKNINFLVLRDFMLYNYYGVIDE